MINNQQQTPMTRKGKLSLLIAGAVLSMAVSAPTLAASASKLTTPSPISDTTLAVIGHEPVMKTAGKVTATDVNKDNVLGENDTLTASGFVFEDADLDTMTISYEWYQDGTVIPGENKDTLILKKAWLGKKITVKAVAKTDSKTTDPAESKFENAKDYLDITNTSVGDKGIPITDGSTVKKVKILGISGSQPLVGETLKAVVTCHDTCDKNKLTYQWQLESSTNVYTNIPRATTEDYTVKNTDQKKKIKVIVSNTK